MHDYISHNFTLDKDDKRFLKEKALSGVEIVDGAARLCAMNLFLHGIGGEEPVAVRDALSSKGSVEFDMVLTNPPFGKKSSRGLHLARHLLSGPAPLSSRTEATA